VEIETNQVVFELARLVGAGIVGGLIASFATHRFTLSRERESGRQNRKRDFRSFVVQFRSEAADRYHPPHGFATFYQNKVPNLRHAAATVRDDFPRRQRTEFDTLISTAAGFTGAQADDGDTGKQRIIDSLDAILRFLDA
jgi:hypothetical protein